VVLDKPMDAVIHVEESLRPGDAAKLNNLVEAKDRRFVVIYDPSPIETYYKPETMQRAKYDIEGIKETLRELMEVRNAWVVIILPSELYEQVQRSKEEDVDLRQVLDNLERNVVTVNLKDEGFLREIIKRYSGCDNVSDDLVRRVMNFDSYTLVAKYAGIWLRERGCGVEDADKALRESAGKPKSFFANYIWSTVLRGNEDLAKKVSIPLILHAAFGPIPEGITYITKAVNEGGVWKLIDRNKLAELKLEDLKEDDLEPIAKWLSTEHEDLIEETLKELVGLQGEEARNNYRNHGFKNFIDVLDWGYEKVLNEFRGLGHEVKPEVVKANLLIFVSERLTSALNVSNNECWKRAIYIIGRALAGGSIVISFKDLSVFLPENLSKSVVESLGDALKECGVDYYLLVGNVIPPLIQHLTRNHARALAGAFIDKYNETTAEIKRVLNIIKNKNRGDIYITDEVVYGLGLALIIAKAAELNKDVEPSDADAALHIASFALQGVASTDLIKPILVALVPLRDKAPQRYLEVLAFALGEIPAWSIGYTLYDRDTVMYIFNEFDYMLKKYRDGVKRAAWTLVYAMDALISFLYKSLKHCDDQWFEDMDASFRTELEHMVNRVASLLDEINRLNPSLGIIAWAHALRPALDNKCVRTLMESVLDIDVVNKAKEVAGELSRLRGSVQELIRDEGFIDFAEFWLAEVDEEAARKEILEETSILKYTLAQYKLYNDELNEAERLFNEAAEESKEINDYDYLYIRNLALRVEAIKGPLAGENLVKLINEFRQLYEETKKHFTPAPPYYGTLLRDILGEYLVSLALTGDNEEIRRIEELLKEQWQGPAGYLLAPILTRLTLNALLSPRGELSGELKDKLVVKPGELMAALGLGYIDINSLPALRATYGTIKRGDEKRLCDESIDDPIIHDLCMSYVSRDYSKELPQQEEGNLRQALINSFQEWISKEEVLDLLKELGLDAGSLNGELRGLVNELSSRSLLAIASSSYCLKDQQLRCSSANLTYMLYALINGNEKLAKAHALYGAVSTTGNKLLTRLFLEAYRACCDPNNDGFKRAIAKLFFLHV
jgi:hypothetical protein